MVQKLRIYPKTKQTLSVLNLVKGSNINRLNMVLEFARNLLNEVVDGNLQILNNANDLELLDS